MAKAERLQFIEQLRERTPSLHRMPNSSSLFVVGNDLARVYVRYSRLHGGNRTFYGLRRQDLAMLAGHNSFICFVWETQAEPLIIPFEEYEDVFNSTAAAPDGQYKVQVFIAARATELYVARAGRFDVEDHFGWHHFDMLLRGQEPYVPPDLSHAQVQTLLGGIGIKKGYQVWIPRPDRAQLDWALTMQFEMVRHLPDRYREVSGILKGVDVVWLRPGESELCALYEIEHSTPIYSGLLRFNDIHLVQPLPSTRFSIVANEGRRSRFVRQMNRPTFRASGLDQHCSFLRYENVFQWHYRLFAAQERVQQ